MAPLGTIASLISRLNQAVSARRAIDEIMKLPVDRPPGAQYLSRPALTGEMAFRNVSFHYPGTEVAALRDISLAVRPGEKVAIMGPVGSGKSTLARMLMRLYDPDDGEILVDGTDIRQVDPADVRHSIGGGASGYRAVPRHDPREHRHRSPGSDRRDDPARRADRRRPRFRRPAPAGIRLAGGGSAAKVSRAGNASASRSPVRCCPIRRSWCSTSPPA